MMNYRNKIINDIDQEQRNYNPEKLNVDFSDLGKQINNFMDKLYESPQYNPKLIKEKKLMDKLIKESFNKIEIKEEVTLYNLFNYCDKAGVHPTKFIKDLYDNFRQLNKYEFYKNYFCKNKNKELIISSFMSDKQEKLFANKDDYNELLKEYKLDNVYILFDKKKQNILIKNREENKILTKFVIISENTDFKLRTKF